MLVDIDWFVGAALAVGCLLLLWVGALDFGCGVAFAFLLLLLGILCLVCFVCLRCVMWFFCSAV